MYDVIIIGGGPAGITAAIYCARANLNVALMDKGLIGGNPLNYLEIDNYPGLPGTTENLVDRFIEHINKYDNIDKFQFVEIDYVDVTNKLVKTVDNEFKANKIIIATGTKPKMLNVEGEKEYLGKGVHYCAICDGPLYKDKKVAVIGGGNSACEEALGLSKICDQVDIIEFTDKLNADKITLDKIYNTQNIAVHLNCKVTKITGNDKVERVWFKDQDSSYDCYLDIDGIFIYVGMIPNLPNFRVFNTPLSYSLSDYLITDENMQTTVQGVYAIGDIRSKDYRQVITAMSDGAIAAIHISKNI